MDLHRPPGPEAIGNLADPRRRPRVDSRRRYRRTRRRPLSLYRSLGFDVTAPCVVMSGSPRGGLVEDAEVQPLTAEDIDECAALCKQVHGFERTAALRDAMQVFAPVVAVRDGRIAAYASTVTFWQMGYGVAEDEAAIKALLLGADTTADEPLALLVPLQSGLFGWSLEQGMRAVKPMNLMARGEYREPRGSYFPSVIY
jgi:hypothetical protein